MVVMVESGSTGTQQSMTPIVLASLFLCSVEVAIAQAPKSPRVEFMPVAAQAAASGNAAYFNAIHELWISMKKQLAGPNGQEYFTNAVQYAAVPLLIGTLLSATPNDHPSILVLSMSDGLTPEVTLHLKDNNRKDSHINGPIMRGSQIQFEGIPVAFTKNPFMLTFDVTTGPKLTHAPMPNIAQESK